MKKYTEMLPYIENGDYDYHFWNAMRGKTESLDRMGHGRSSATGTYAMAPISNNKYMKALAKESLFRNIGTVVNAFNSGYRILAKDCKDVVAWVPENGEVPMADPMDDFTQLSVDSHKLAVFLKTDEDFVRDATFDFEAYLTQRLAKNFGRAEDKAFITGTGEGMPTGILCPGKGAEVGLTTDKITYEDIVKLFLSVNVEYRRNGAWLMNDETAIFLRTLKDSGGNYIWNHANDTLLGKRVITSEYMPTIESGSMPILFGDYSFYWVIGRSPVSVRPITEMFVTLNQIGHLAFEFLDGKLIRREAVKGIKITDTAPAE